ncbi:alpha/beta fold hydrolase [Eubacteriales bacterium SGI.150]
MSYFKYKHYSCYYEEYGSGNPTVFLHGNTASSKMFELLLPLYQNRIKVILLDFLGNGRSDRVEYFPPNIWYDEALQTIALIDYLGYEKVSLVGTSGGAWAAINAALDCPSKIQCVVADSFDGRTLHEGFGEGLKKERAFAINDTQASQFYEWCQGPDWEEVVKLDTAALIECEKSKLPLFHKDIGTLEIPTLLMGSKEDQMVRNNLYQEYQSLQTLIKNASIHMFEHGNHPAIFSNAEEAANIIVNFVIQSK